MSSPYLQAVGALINFVLVGPSTYMTPGWKTCIAYTIRVYMAFLILVATSVKAECFQGYALSV
jgi:hypothetical protein